MNTPRHFVRLFQPRFAPLVESGEKCQTVRPVPKRMPRPGDTISLRCWVGAPYRSKQRVLREARIEKVAEIVIAAEGVLPVVVRALATGALSCWPTPDDFARADGFADWPAMRAWFEQQHGLPFAGIVIYWSPGPEVRYT